MRRIASLGCVAGVEVWGAVGIDLVLAVRLVLVLALAALQARVYLRTNTNSLANLGQRHLGADADDLANDFVSHRQRVGAVAPIAADGVAITGTDTAALCLDIDIIVAKGSGLPRALLKLEPLASAGGLEAGKLVGNCHLELFSCCMPGGAVTGLSRRYNASKLIQRQADFRKKKKEQPEESAGEGETLAVIIAQFSGHRCASCLPHHHHRRGSHCFTLPAPFSGVSAQKQ